MDQLNIQVIDELKMQLKNEQDKLEKVLRQKTSIYNFKTIFETTIL